MKYTIEQLSFIVPAFSIGFLAIITSINLYFKIRKRFPLTVNCWFCNENSRIPYLDNNKWTCKKCEQYNGFTKEGDYNCDIPAQRSSKLNKWKNSKNLSFSSMNGSIISSRNIPTNGLCQPCNRNQELKVQQLASFEPQNDAYFDEEIAEYRTKLEQAYRLCPRCERSLKRALNKVKTNILGSKLKQIGAKGLRAFDLSENGSANKQPTHKKRHLFVRISLLTLISISLLQLYAISNRINITKTKLDSIFNASTTTFILTVLSYFAAVQIVIGNLINNLLIMPNISYAVSSVRLFIKYLYTLINGDIWTIINVSIANLIELNDAEQTANIEFATLMLNLAGCFMSTFVLFLIGLKFGPILSLLLWSCNMFIPCLTQDTTTLQSALIFDLAQLILMWSLTVLSFVNVYSQFSKEIAPNAKDTSFHRLESESNSDASDSEIESELETSLRSNASSIGGNRSMWEKTHVLDSTIASSSTSITSQQRSLLAQKRQFTSSTQSLCSLRLSKNKKDTSFGSVCGFNGSNHMDFVQNQFHPNQTAFVTSSQNQLNRSHCIPFRSQNYPDPDIISRCASRYSLYDVPDDFESGITQLSISGIGGKPVNYRKQTRIFGSSDRIRDSLQKSILAPSRLSINEHGNQSSSWLAGGFWNNSTSPQKRCASQMNHAHIERNGVTKAFEAVPLMSRTSSHSSGFESMKNSTNNSRENSLCDDNDLDQTFLFCEPASVARASPATTITQPNRIIMNQTALDSENEMSVLSTEMDQTAFFRSITSPKSNEFLIDVKTLPPKRFPTLNEPYDTRFPKEFPTRSYQRGSLLKLNMTYDH